MVAKNRVSEINSDNFWERERDGYVYFVRRMRREKIDETKVYG
jgi:hypothetical protein